MHWFFKRGFVQVVPGWLFEVHEHKYNWDYRSMVCVRKLA